jgi:hypothetical protein
MHIKYKIVDVYPNDHNIIVRYYTDDLPESELMSAPGLREDGTSIRCRTDVSITLPVPEPTADELNKIIMLNCPLGFFELQEKIKDPSVDTSMTVSSSLLNVEKTTTAEEILDLTKPAVPTENAPLTDAEIEELIQKL